MAKRVILVMRYHVIEPLGVLYLLGVAKRAGWDAQVILIKESDFTPLFDLAKSFKPDLVGFSIWTGWHVQTFKACDEVRALGFPVAIGGPHATFNADACLPHADYVVKGEGFRLFRELLEGKLAPGIHFDEERMAEGFPVPDRELLYNIYPELGKSSIKSIMCSVGCPFKCSYCYAPHYNNMYGGFELTLRPVDEVVEEGIWIRENFPCELIYFQDDIFGFNLTWLAEFAEKWPTKVGIPWHCQIRLEMTRDERRLDFFKAGGCTGITLAIESGNDFLREFVLFRGMSDELIEEGIRRIQDRGLTLRTEQILAVPFSDIQTDIETLKFNVKLKPSMAWTSILQPYGGTNMGTIASKFGFWRGTNDDLDESFFDRSTLQHVQGGRASIEPVARALKNGKESSLLGMKVDLETANGSAKVFSKDFVGIGGLPPDPACEIRYLSPEENARYCDQTAILQRNFDWFSKVPAGHELATRFVALPKEEWTWATLGKMAEEHFVEQCGFDNVQLFKAQVAEAYGGAALPAKIAENPFPFFVLPSGPAFARYLIEKNVLETPDQKELFDAFGREVRYWLYGRALYRTEVAEPAILSL
ncbi:MAG: cobalamin-dependent protein [Pyrinomonadaceae bacterium]